VCEESARLLQGAWCACRCPTPCHHGRSTLGNLHAACDLGVCAGRDLMGAWGGAARWHGAIRSCVAGMREGGLQAVKGTAHCVLGKRGVQERHAARHSGGACDAWAQTHTHAHAGEAMTCHVQRVLSASTHYEVLQLSSDANEGAVLRARRTMALVTHPDKAGMGHPDLGNYSGGSLQGIRTRPPLPPPPPTRGQGGEPPHPQPPPPPHPPPPHRSGEARACLGGDPAPPPPQPQPPPQQPHHRQAHASDHHQQHQQHRHSHHHIHHRRSGQVKHARATDAIQRVNEAAAVLTDSNKRRWAQAPVISFSDLGAGSGSHHHHHHHPLAHVTTAPSPV
jgi:hypothetical protein